MGKAVVKKCVNVPIPEMYQFGTRGIEVSFTKIDNAGLKKDDTKSKDATQAKQNWRFSANKDSKFRRICLSRLRKLTASVIVSNIPDGKMEIVKKHIIESGYTVKAIE